MEKYLSVLIALVVILVCSCDLGINDGQTEGSGSASLGKLTSDLSTLVPGGSLSFDGVTADTVIDLSNFSLEDGIFIEIESGRGVTTSRDGQAENVFKRQNGTFIPVPDLSGLSSFTGAALGVVYDAVRININRALNLDTDLTIDTSSEAKYLNRDGLAEEFYYISFLDPRWASLDKSEIVVLQTGTVGARGLSVVQSGYLNASQNGVLDFTRQQFLGFGVNMHCVYSDGRDMVEKLSILNPIHVDASEKTLDYINVIRVNEQQSGEYKVVVTITGPNNSDVVRNIATDYANMNLHPRYTSGEDSDRAVFPEYDLDGGTITYHVGSVDRDLLFNLVFEGVEGFDPANATITLQPDNEGIVVHDLAALLEEHDSAIISTETRHISTWAFETNQSLSIDVQRLHNDIGGSFYFSEESYQKGTRGLFDCSINIRANSTGYFVLWNDSLAADVDVVKLGKKNHQNISCRIVEWNPETRDYVCVDDGCESCTAIGAKKHYSFDFLGFNKDIIFKDQYWTAGTFGEYGRIGYTKGNSVLCSNPSVVISASTTGNKRADDPYGTFAWNPSDSSQKVEIRVKKIYTEENKLVCDIAIDGSDAFQRDVEMIPSHVNHNWEYNDGYVTCNYEGCNESRRAISLMVGPGGPYRIIVNGAVDLSVPALDYNVTCSTIFNSPSLPISAQILFIAPSNGYSVSYTNNGNDYYITLREEQ